MNIALCYESVLPERGGCETYIADLARRLAADRHELHLYACRRDESALPANLHFHEIPRIVAPRFLRPWRFSRACIRAMSERRHAVSVGFDKTFGQDVLYPLGGLHAASVEHNLLKYASPKTRRWQQFLKLFDLAHWSYTRLQRRQYLGPEQPEIVVASEMVRQHFVKHLDIPEERIVIVPNAIDLDRFPQHDRLKLRLEGRQAWNLAVDDVAGLFVAKNYRLKGLEPLLYSVRCLVHRPEFINAAPPFRLLVCGSDDTKQAEALAKKLRIESYVRFVGAYRDIRQAFFASDFLVHPTFYDPCSLVVLEALACDLPVITSRYNGAAELIEPPREGLVIDDPHDHERLGWCMAQMLDTQKRRGMAQNARKTAQRWTFDHHYRSLLRVFQDVAARKKAA